MKYTYVFHILAGTISLLSGYTALYAVKGVALHRKAGMLFVVAMLTMCFLGTLMAIVRGKAPAVNVPAASITAYLVMTSLTTVRTPAWWKRWMDVAFMFVPVAVAVATLMLGVEAVNSGGKRQGIPAFPFFMFAFIGLLSAFLDIKMIRAGGVQAIRGTSRLVRHLWRMSYALFIAAMSFFLGQADVIPKPIRIPALLAVFVAAPLLTMLYWVWRVRIKRSLRGMVGLRATGVA